MGAFDDLIPKESGAFDDLIPPPVQENPPAEAGPIEGAVRAIGRGVPVVGAFLDEANAATGAALDPLVPQALADALGIEKLPGDFQQRYEAALKQQRGMDAAFDEENPVLSPALQVAGGMAAGGALLKGAPVAGKAILGMGGKTTAGQVAAGAASAGGLGAAHGFGSGEGTFEDRLVESGKGAAFGAVLGGAFPVLAKGLGRAWGAFTNQAAPSLKSIKTQSQRLYKKADKINLLINKDKVQSVVDDIQSALREQGYHPRIHPRVSAALDELGVASAEDLSLKNAQILRRIAQSAGKSTEPDEQRVGGALVDMIDDFLENVSPGDVISGDPKLANTILRDARTLWGRYRKGETIEKLLELAELNAPNFSGPGAENAIRTEFRNLAKQLVRDPRKARMFTAAERKAIEKVAKGGPLGNLLRMLGKFAPTGVVSSALSGGTGLVVGGPAGAVALPAAGFAARQGATRVTLGNARAASELVRRGGAAPTSKAVKTLADYARGSAQGAVPTLGQQATTRMENYLSIP